MLDKTAGKHKIRMAAAMGKTLERERKNVRKSGPNNHNDKGHRYGN
jgi:hypothetical protein